MSAAGQVVRARIDEDVKKRATEIFNQMGITMSGAIRMFFAQVVAEKVLPFEVRVPNAVTQEAIATSRAGEVSSFASVDDLFADLEDDDDAE